MNNFDFTVQDFIDYYVNLLIIQYKTKPKAMAHIGLYAELLAANLILFQLERSFDIDTAVGKQLDILAQYVGAKRTIDNYIIERNYFTLKQYGIASANNFGLKTYGIAKAGYFYSNLINKNSFYTLLDAELRTIIKFLIIKNNIDSKFYNVVNNVNNFFGTQLLIYDAMTMKWIIFINNDFTNLLKICLSQDYFFRPLGISLKIYQIQNKDKLFSLRKYGQTVNNYNQKGMSSYGEFNEGYWIKYQDAINI